jgi:predicted nucleotidyltransferase component of viral defense system
MKFQEQSGNLHKYYEKIYRLQDKILQIVFEKTTEHNFYLTGGTALNRFYYPVRYSEDLDFFTNENTLFREDLRFIMDSFQKYKISFLKEVDFRDFVRLLLFSEDIKLKVDFVNDRVYRYGKSVYYKQMRLDNVINILTNKICAILSRDEAKDVADLLTIAICENFVWDEIIAVAQKKEKFEKFFLVERLKSFPLELLDTCHFIKTEFKIRYKELLPELIKNLIEGTENKLNKFCSLFQQLTR